MVPIDFEPGENDYLSLFQYQPHHFSQFKYIINIKKTFALILEDLKSKKANAYFIYKFDFNCNLVQLCRLIFKQHQVIRL